jgi:type I restriction enzyme S subunit
MLGAGGQKRVPEEFLKDWPLARPSLAQQERIADFLDLKTEQIDGLIAKKERLLELLAEKRQALTTRAVTKGLNPDAPMKPSGIDWLGDIPEHWKVYRLKRCLCSAEYGISASLDAEGTVAVLRMGNLVDGRLDFNDLKFVADLAPGMELRGGDVLFNRTNSLALVGKTALYRGDYSGKLSFASYLVRLRVADTILPDFVNYLANTDGFLGLAQTLALPSIGQANLNPTRYTMMQWPIPPIGEQAEIVRTIEEHEGRAQETLDTIRKGIGVLHEYRSALITAAVTGSLDLEAA